MSTLVTTYLHRDSIYTMKLTRRGIDLYEQEHHNLLKGLFQFKVVGSHAAVVDGVSQVSLRAGTFFGATQVVPRVQDGKAAY